MKWVSRFAVVVSFLATLGCATKPYVETDFDQAYNFAGLKTFFVAETKQDFKDSILVSPFTLSHIQAVLQSELAKRYQAPAANQKPDFVVSYHVVMEEKIDPRSYNELYGFGWYGRGYYYPAPRPFFYGAGTGIRTYNQGSLIIDIVDGKTDKPIWRGVSEKRLSQGMSPQKQREILSQAVTEVMAEFPPVH